MSNFIMQIIVFSVIGGVVWGLSRLLHCKSLDQKISKPRKSSLQALIAISISVLLFIVVTVLIRSLPIETSGSEIRYSNLVHTVQQFLPLVFMLLPMIMFVIRNGESLSSIGITSINLWQSALIGLLLALMTFYLQNDGFLAVLEKLKPRHGYSFIYFAFVGFQEEILFRGYLQNRLIAWFGKWKGWFVASAVMAVAHFPQRILIGNMDPGEAFSSACGLLPASLLFGYIMICTKNVLAPGLLHTFTNWISELQ